MEKENEDEREMERLKGEEKGIEELGREGTDRGRIRRRSKETVAFISFKGVGLY